MRTVLSFFCILLGVCSLICAGYLYWERVNPSPLSFTTPPPFSAHLPSHAQPLQITITSVGINLRLYPAAIRGKTWDTTSQGASYLTTSPIPGDKGNSIIYAHNWTSLFGNLVLVKPGEKVTIRYQDRTEKSFTIAFTSQVSPQDTSILNQSEDRRITLYTCYGFLDTKRFVVVAVLTS